MVKAAIVLAALVAAAPAWAGKGNDLPPGPHYMLNVIAFDADQCPSGDFTGSNRHMIAVAADFTPDGSGDLGKTQAGQDKNTILRNNTISLTRGDEFRVLDGNACDKGAAEFMLPADPFACDLDGDGSVDGAALNDPGCIDQDLTFQEYRVFVRLVGKPNTAIGVTTCASENTLDVDGDGLPDGIDVDGNGTVDDTVLCSTESVVRVRDKGRKFEDVTRELVTLCLDTLDDGIIDGMCDVRYGLFDPDLIDYFWQWNTSGKAHAQLVFVPIPD